MSSAGYHQLYFAMHPDRENGVEAIRPSHSARAQHRIDCKLGGESDGTLAGRGMVVGRERMDDLGEVRIAIEDVGDEVSETGHRDQIQCRPKSVPALVSVGG